MTKKSSNWDASGAMPINEFIKDQLLRKTYHLSMSAFRYTAPQKVFKWENIPTDSDAYLFPVMSKKYLKEIGYYD